MLRQAGADISVVTRQSGIQSNCFVIMATTSALVHAREAFGSIERFGCHRLPHYTLNPLQPCWVANLCRVWGQSRGSRPLQPPGNPFSLQPRLKAVIHSLDQHGSAESLTIFHGPFMQIADDKWSIYSAALSEIFDNAPAIRQIKLAIPMSMIPFIMRLNLGTRLLLRGLHIYIWVPSR